MISSLRHHCRCTNMGKHVRIKLNFLITAPKVFRHVMLTRKQGKALWCVDNCVKAKWNDGNF